MVKIGDKVRFNNGYNPNSDCTISDIAYRSDHGVTYYYFDGDTRNSFVGWEESTFTVISNEDELDSLRAFKAAAIARFPALAEPETDDEAIARFTEALDNEGFGEGWNDILREAFKWARANPR